VGVEVTSDRWAWHTFTPNRGEFTIETPGGSLILVDFLMRHEAARNMRDNDRPAFASCIDGPGLVGFVAELHVNRHEGRGKGIGSRLLSKALDKLRELGIRSVFLRAVPLSPELRTDLLRFYGRHGFEIALDCMDEPPGYYPILQATLE